MGSRIVTFMVQGLHESRCKLRPAVRDYLRWDTMQAEDLLVVDVGDSFCVNIQGCGDDMHLFTIMVNIYRDRIIPFDFREASD